MSTWTARLQIRSITGPVVFSVSDVTYALDGPEMAYYENFIGRYFREVARQALLSPVEGPTFRLINHMQIRGMGMSLRRT
jgi:hypothetical protein